LDERERHHPDRHKQVKREEILVEVGDHVILRGTEYEIAKDRYGYVSLTPVTA
jgi:hypothetical protein